MGREKKILLTLLCLLSGTFVGVLSAKLLVPRPPAGAGPDVHAEAIVAPSDEIVEPPALSERPAAPLVSRAGFEERIPVPAALVADPEAVPVAAARSSRFTAAADDPAVEGVATSAAAADEEGESVAGIAVEPPPSRQQRDPFVRRSALEEPVVPSDGGRAFEPPPPPAVASSSPFPAGGYVTVTGDSWWSLAERAYGDGRLYRALFAWNRAIDPRVSLVPGTRLDVPPRQRLEASSPHLIPAE
jgi:5'-nucleotidase / UDP-sugar diphosphatase